MKRLPDSLSTRFALYSAILLVAIISSVLKLGDSSCTMQNSQSTDIVRFLFCHGRIADRDFLQRGDSAVWRAAHSQRVSKGGL